MEGGTGDNAQTGRRGRGVDFRGEGAAPGEGRTGGDGRRGGGEQAASEKRRCEARSGDRNGRPRAHAEDGGRQQRRQEPMEPVRETEEEKEKQRERKARFERDGARYAAEGLPEPAKFKPGPGGKRQVPFEGKAVCVPTPLRRLRTLMERAEEG